MFNFSILYYFVNCLLSIVLRQSNGKNYLKRINAFMIDAAIIYYNQYNIILGRYSNIQLYKIYENFKYYIILKPNTFQ